MRIMVLGCDGYLGWPTCMYLAARGHEVFGVDDLSKRRIGRDPLVPLPVDAPEATRQRVGSVNLLQQNYPNPFRTAAPTTIGFTLERPTDVKLTIYNVKGQVVRVLEQGRREAGNHSVQWDGRDHSGKTVAAGIYFYEIQAGNVRESKKMIRLQ